MRTALALVKKNRKDNKIMREDEVGIVFCNQKTANKLIEQDANVKDACVIWSLIDDNTAIVASQEEFIKWLEENGE